MTVGHGDSRRGAQLPPEQFKVAGDFADSFYTRPGLRWRLRRRLDPRAHRHFVGSDAGSGLDFRAAGRFQLDFLVGSGLRSDSVLLDLGCGSLRGGLHFIEFLDAGCYLGLDSSEQAVRRGIERELGLERFAVKRPEFVITDRFDVDRFSKRPDIVFANSLFTHLPAGDVEQCLDRLRAFAGDHPTDLYATFTEVGSGTRSDGVPHYAGGRVPITYTRDDLASLARSAGWTGEYIGGWGHPKNDWPGELRRQMMMSFRPAP